MKKNLKTQEILLSCQIKLRELKEINKKIEKELILYEKKIPSREEIRKINKIWKFGLEILINLEKLNKNLENTEILEETYINSIKKLADNFKILKNNFKENLKKIKNHNLDEYYTSSEYISSNSKNNTKKMSSNDSKNFFSKNNPTNYFSKLNSKQSQSNNIKKLYSKKILSKNNSKNLLKHNLKYNSKNNSKNNSKYDSLSESLLENDLSEISGLNFQEALINERKKDIEEINSAILDLKKLKCLFSEIIKKDDLKIDMILKKQVKFLEYNKDINQNVLKTEINQNQVCRYFVYFLFFVGFIIFGYFFYYLVLKSKSNEK